tara:strand:+ start:62 stop:388 length:327 start_codon:yes stop_codon:yes gene_type:complete
MKKIVISVIGITAIGLTTAAAAISSDCGYDADGNFRLGNGQVAASGTWEHAKECAMKGILPSVVAERLGRLGDESTQREADELRETNTRVQEEKKKREVEVQPLPPAK